MNIAFFGTPPFTTEFLDTLVKSDYSPSLIVTGPDRPAGRGMTMQSPAPKKWGDEHTIKVIQPEKLNDDFLAELSQTHWDLFVVAAYGKILPERVINLPKYGTINVHYSLLPKYRGATPVESAILNGDARTGITIQQMTYILDSGDILATIDTLIEPTDTAPILRSKLNDLALTLLTTTIRDILAGATRAVPQDDSLTTSCKKIKKEDGEIYLADDPITNDRKYRAYYGWPGSYFFINKNGARLRIKINKAHLEGTLWVIDEVTPENGKRLTWEQYQHWISE